MEFVHQTAEIYREQAVILYSSGSYGSFELNKYKEDGFSRLCMHLLNCSTHAVKVHNTDRRNLCNIFFGFFLEDEKKRAGSMD